MTVIAVARTERGPSPESLLDGLQFLFVSRKRNLCVSRRKQFVGAVLAFMVGAVLVQPLVQMLARGGREFREEESGAALVARPHHIGVTMKRDFCSGQHAAECQIRNHRHWLGSLHGKSMLSDVDADSWDCAGRQFKIDERLHVVALGLAPVFLAWLASGRQALFHQFRVNRLVKNAAGAGLKSLASAGPRAAGDRKQRGLLLRWQQIRHADDLLGSLEIAIHDERRALSGHDQLECILARIAIHEVDFERVESGLESSKGPIVLAKNGSGLAHELQSTLAGET